MNDGVERLIRNAAPLNPNDPDYDDVLQEGRIAALGRTTTPRPLLHTILRRRMIDAVRTIKGDSRRPSGRHLDRPSATVGITQPHHDPDPLWEPPTTGDERLDHIIRRLADGATKQEIATELGVHPSRISQLIRTIRTHLDTPPTTA